MGIVYDGRCCGCGYGMQNCHCVENRRKFEKYAAELFSNDGKTTDIGAYVIEADGSIHKLRFVGDADWYDEIVTTLSDIRNSVIDEFVEKAWEVLGAEDRDIYARESIIEIAEMLKKKGNVDIHG